MIIIITHEWSFRHQRATLLKRHRVTSVSFSSCGKTEVADAPLPFFSL